MLHTALFVGEHAVEAYLPAAHVVQAEQGAKPVADHVLPATQAVAATHESETLLHTKAGALQAQLVWFTSTLLVLKPAVEPVDVPSEVHSEQAVWLPASGEKVCAGQPLHAAFVVDVHADERNLPAAHVEEEQAEHGGKPVAEYEPAAQAGAVTHASDAVLHT